jgi:diguanylate cyclase (GGDEF)-like protein
MSGETGIRDLLTGLFTRDYFDEIIGRELERSRRSGVAVSVLSVVLANRAWLVTNAGEDGADSAVMAMAKLLQSNVRPVDMVFRWDEDEFIVLLSETDLGACNRKVQQLAGLFRPWREGAGPVAKPVKVRIGASTHARDVAFPSVLQAARAAARNQTQV